MAGHTLKKADPKELKVHLNVMVGSLKARGTRHHDAEDLAAEALCKGLDVENLRNPEGWLHRVLFRGAYTLGRRKKTAANHRQALGHHAARIRGQAVVNPGHEMECREEAENLGKIMTEALAILTDLDRAILLHWVETYSTYEELSHRFDLSRAAVKGRLRRARARLRKYLARRLYGSDGMSA